MNVTCEPFAIWAVAQPLPFTPSYILNAQTKVCPEAEVMALILARTVPCATPEIRSGIYG